MTKKLLHYLCDPVDKSDLALIDPVYDEVGAIVSGTLVSSTGRTYPILNGVPRFVNNLDIGQTVESFGDEWNHFNYDLFKVNWLNHVVKNTFGDVSIFKNKVVVDAGGGSGMQSLWMSEAGASHVICLELSHSVDGIMKKNLAGARNVDVIQCSIDQPPLKDNSIEGLVMCHNVIQHTPSVEDTARALWSVVATNGEFVFNCYGPNDLGFLRRMRLSIYYLLRSFLSKRSFAFILTYSRIMAVLRFVPLIGWFLEKSRIALRGDVPRGPNYIKRAYVSCVLNTFDCYGSHAFQHLKSDKEIRQLVNELQSNADRVLNYEKYFERPAPIGCALRLVKS